MHRVKHNVLLQDTCLTVGKLKALLNEYNDDMPIMVMSDYDDSEWGAGSIYDFAQSLYESYEEYIQLGPRNGATNIGVKVLKISHWGDRILPANSR